MYHVRIQCVDECMINVHYYHYFSSVSFFFSSAKYLVFLVVCARFDLLDDVEVTHVHDEGSLLVALTVQVLGLTKHGVSRLHQAVNTHVHTVTPAVIFIS